MSEELRVAIIVAWTLFSIAAAFAFFVRVAVRGVVEDKESETVNQDMMNETARLCAEAFLPRLRRMAGVHETTLHCRYDEFTSSYVLYCNVVLANGRTLNGTQQISARQIAIARSPEHVVRLVHDACQQIIRELRNMIEDETAFWTPAELERRPWWKSDAATAAAAVARAEELRRAYLDDGGLSPAPAPAKPAPEPAPVRRRCIVVGDLPK